MEKLWSLYYLPTIKRYIIQGNMHFRVTADSFLVSDFFNINSKCKQILEIGSGTGIIPIILSSRINTPIITVEIQDLMANLTKINIEINRISNTVFSKHCDILEYKNLFKPDSFTDIICNPPFFENSLNHKQEKINQTVQISKTENELTFDKLVMIAKYLLKSSGNLTLIHRSEYTEKILKTLTKYSFSISRMQFVYTSRKSEAKMILIHACKKSLYQCRVLEPLFLTSQTLMRKVSDFTSSDEAIEFFKTQI